MKTAAVLAAVLIAAIIIPAVAQEPGDQEEGALVIPSTKAALPAEAGVVVPLPSADKDDRTPPRTAEQAEAELRKLLPDADKLPQRWAIKTVTPEDRRGAPVWMINNPHVTRSRELLAAPTVALGLSPEKVQAFLSLVWMNRIDDQEVGLYAWHFETVGDARAAVATLAAGRGPAEGYCMVRRKGPVVAMLWRDRVDGTTFYRFAELLEEKLPLPELPELAAGAFVPDLVDRPRAGGPAEDERKGGVVFFGAPAGAASAKVVYVVDKSGSMYDTFSHVQAELTRSIKSLKEGQQFDVIFFADDRRYELTLNNEARMHAATIPAKRAAIEWIDKQIAESRTGRTDPRKALALAFERKPDVIYFLTDGLFPPETRDEIRKLNPKVEVIVNTIAFKSRAGEKLLTQIAADNRGIYKYISGPQLGESHD